MTERNHAAASIAATARLISLLYSLPMRTHPVPVRWRTKVLPVMRAATASDDGIVDAVMPVVRPGAATSGWMQALSAEAPLSVAASVRVASAGMVSPAGGVGRTTVSPDIGAGPVRSAGAVMPSRPAPGLPPALALVPGRGTPTAAAAAVISARRLRPAGTDTGAPERPPRPGPAELLPVAIPAGRQDAPGMQARPSVTTGDTVLSVIAGGVRARDGAVAAIPQRQSPRLLPAGVEQAAPARSDASVLSVQSAGGTTFPGPIRLDPAGPIGRGIEAMSAAIPAGRKTTPAVMIPVPRSRDGGLVEPSRAARFIPPARPASQQAMTGAANGAGSVAGPAPVQPDRNVTVQLSGELIVDGRQLGRISADTLSRDASLPLSTQSRPSLRSTTLYTGMRIPS